MAFLALYLTIFVMFFQPTTVFPQLALYSPLKYMAIFSLILYFFFAKGKNTNFFENKINKYFIFFSIFYFLSGVLVWLPKGIDCFNLFLKYGIVYFLIFKLCSNERKIFVISSSIILAISYLSFVSLSNYVVMYSPGLRASGFGWYENANDLSFILVCTIPLAMCIFELSKKRIVKNIFLSFVFIFIANLLFTGSRNGLLGLLVVGGLSILFFDKMSKTLRIVFVSFLLILIAFVGISVVMERTDLSGGSLTGDDSSENRIVQWKAGLRMMAAHPFFGVGPDEFESNSQAFRGERGLAPHNTIIQVFAEIGILGGIFFVLMNYYAMKSCYFIFRRNVGNRNMRIVLHKYLFISMCGYWTCAFFGNRDKSYILYVLLAMISSQYGKNYVDDSVKIKSSASV